MPALGKAESAPVQAPYEESTISTAGFSIDEPVPMCYRRTAGSVAVLWNVFCYTLLNVTTLWRLLWDQHGCSAPINAKHVWSVGSPWPG